MALTERQVKAVLKLFAGNVVLAEDEDTRKQLYQEFENYFKGAVPDWESSILEAFHEAKASEKIIDEWTRYTEQHKVFKAEDFYKICDMSLDDEKAIIKLLADELGLMPRLAQFNEIGSVKDYMDTGFSFVAKCDGKVVGVVMAQKIMDYGSNYIMLDNFAVTENEQGRGVGRMLMNHLMGLAREAEIHTIKLHTHKNLKAYDIYCHMGFKPQNEESVYMKTWFI